MIDNYIILDQNLGKGSHTKVQLIEKDNKKYVLKKIFIKDFRQKEIDKAKLEIEILKKFNNENITEYYDSCIENNEYLNILMEYGGKSDLDTLIKEHKDKNEPIDEKIIIKIILQICLGLKEIHKANIIHRDLKPANIFIDDSYKIKIGDFGVSKILEPNNFYASSIAGNFQYQALEILKGKYNNKVDIYSLGCIIYELLTLNNYYVDKMSDDIKNIDTNSYNKEWKALIDLLLQVDYHKRPDVDEVYEFIEDNLINFTFSKGDEITLIYDVSDGHVFNIFGDKFVENNKGKIDLIINQTKIELTSKYQLNKGENTVTMILKDDVRNLQYMFYQCYCLSYKNNLKKFNTKYIYDFSYMFFHCSNWLNLCCLKGWDVSGGRDFSCMFGDCYYFSNLDALENWNVSNGEKFYRMFWRCSKLSNINGLRRWDTSNGISFQGMFIDCESLVDLSALSNWNVSKGCNFSSLFFSCKSIKYLYPLKQWDVSNGYCFEEMFWNCTSLVKLDGLENWEVSKAECFKSTFAFCSSLSDISALKNWKVSNVNIFSGMFNACSKLKNLYALKNWDVSKGLDFSYMFCKLINLNEFDFLYGWKISRSSNVSQMLSMCGSTLLNFNKLELSEEQKNSIMKEE